MDLAHQCYSPTDPWYLYDGQLKIFIKFWWKIVNKHFFIFANYPSNYHLLYYDFMFVCIFGYFGYIQIISCIFKHIHVSKSDRVSRDHPWIKSILDCIQASLYSWVLLGTFQYYIMQYKPNALTSQPLSRRPMTSADHQRACNQASKSPESQTPVVLSQSHSRASIWKRRLQKEVFTEAWEKRTSVDCVKEATHSCAHFHF